jgi:tetratricopeptide (TPR) repeat protein
MSARLCVKIAAAGAMLLACAAATRTEAAACDPQASVLNQAEHLNKQGQYDAALALVTPITARPPADFRASYVEGMIRFDKANAADPYVYGKPAQPLSPPLNDALQLLIKTAATLPQQDPACVRQSTLYDIYNTIGAYYLLRGYPKDAQVYLQRGYDHQGELSPVSRKRLLNNLGQAYLLQFRADDAIRTFTEAKAAGSTVADTQIGRARLLQPFKLKAQ